MYLVNSRKAQKSLVFFIEYNQAASFLSFWMAHFITRPKKNRRKFSGFFNNFKLRLGNSNPEVGLARRILEILLKREGPAAVEVKLGAPFFGSSHVAVEGAVDLVAAAALHLAQTDVAFIDTGLSVLELIFRIIQLYDQVILGIILAPNVDICGVNAHHDIINGVAQRSQNMLLRFQVLSSRRF